MSEAAVAPPLEGVRVLDLSRLLPGPMCTLHLAEMGADVVKVEDPERGDYARGMDARDGEPSAFFRLVNRNKRSIVLDLKSPAGRAAFLRLADGADVIVEGFRPGIAQKLGIGYAAAAARNPRIVYCSISGYGQTGPYRERAGHDINYLGYAGILDQTGRADGPPALCNLQIADLLGGALTAAAGILAALVGAKISGRGRYVDVAMAESALAHNVFSLHALSSRGATAARGEDFLTGGLPCYGVYPTRDRRWLAVGALEEKFWSTLCDTLERPDLKPLQFATGEEGRATRHVLEAIFSRQPLAFWMDRFASADCCVSPVLTLEEALANPHFIARRMVLQEPGGGTRYGSPFRFEPGAAPVYRSPPRQGEHTAEVLREAGFAPAEISALTAR
jgi:crotonobetainyl-CoA:carnitine CoA-transferase CaiB-like acyl-CoA transferase